MISLNRELAFFPSVSVYKDCLSYYQWSGGKGRWTEAPDLTSSTAHIISENLYSLASLSFLNFILEVKKGMSFFGLQS